MRAKLEVWAYRNPWMYAACMALFGLGISALEFRLGSHLGAIVCLVIAVVGFVALGWSASRGPGRHSLERRIQQRQSN